MGQMASSSVPSLIKDEEPRTWAELPSELTFSILNRLGTIDILENAQKVCRPWRRVCKDPSMWRKIDMHNLGDFARRKYELEIMCCHAVDCSQGGLVEIDISDFGTDDLLYYIADRSSNLRSLRLTRCQITDEGVAKAVVKLPFLEELDVSFCAFSGKSLRVVGRSCPNLKTLKLNNPALGDFYYEPNIIAKAIAESMPGLRHLQLFGNRLNNHGLNAILDSCSHLDHLDLRKCFNINLFRDLDLEKKCSEMVRVLRRPDDSTSDFPFQLPTHLSEIDTDSDCGADHDVDFEFSCPSPSDYH